MYQPSSYHIAKLDFERLETRQVLSAVSFLSRSVVELGSRPRQVVSGDINGDGRTDLVAFDADKLTLVENLGDTGNAPFAAKQIDQVALQSITLADLDGDGDLDIVGAQQQDFGTTVSDRVFWMENLDGNGQFSKRQRIASSDWFWIGQIVVTDFDEDNDADLVIGTGGGLGGGSVLWLENVGGENFSDPKPVGGFETAISVDTRDIDRDGDLDVFAAFGSDFPYLLLTWYENDGSQKFTPREIQEFPPQSNSQSFPTGEVFADLDGDGDWDAISGLSSFVIGEDGIPTDVLSVGWNENVDGRGEFASREIIWQSESTGWVQLLDVVDLDSDGDQDLLTTISGDLHVFENVTSDKGIEFIAPSPLGDSSANQFVATDLDGDQDLDLVGSVANGISWLEQRRVGDLTNDGAVNFADFLVMASRFGLNDAEWEDGDLDGDEVVTFRDFLVFADQFGT